jgi:2-C-methyl-D-erythritol 4-phosphate cytidylyltransferase
VIERAGVAVVHVEGAPDNLKITFPHDLAVAEAIAKSLRRDREG